MPQVLVQRSQELLSIVASKQLQIIICCEFARGIQYLIKNERPLIKSFLVWLR